MAEKLRKAWAGGVYTRRPAIEAMINELALLPREKLLDRVRVGAPAHPDFIASECILYFLRQSKRDNASYYFETLFRALFARVERAALILGATHVVNGKPALTSKAAKIRDAVIDQFEQKLIRDRNGYDDGLDYFEVNFAGAIASLRSTAARKTFRDDNREQPLSFKDDEAISPEVERAAGSFDPLEKEKLDEPTYRSRFYAAIRELPTKERQVVMLLAKEYLMHSTDPNVVTISSLLGCAEKTVRNRRDRAFEKIRKALQGDEVK